MADIKIDTLFRSKRCTIGLEVTRDALLVVRAPMHVSLGSLQNMLQKKRDWILKKQSFFQQRKDRYPPRRFVDGEHFFYLGRSYRFAVVEGTAIRLTDLLEFPKSLFPDARGHLVRWYKAAAHETITGRVRHYSGLAGLSFSRIKISGARNRLGSCSTKGALCFSWRLVMAPLETIDYVVVHELMHLGEMNHSRKFWDKVRSVIPDHKKRAAWLKENRDILAAL